MNQDRLILNIELIKYIFLIWLKIEVVIELVGSRLGLDGSGRINLISKENIGSKSSQFIYYFLDLRLIMIGL
jgi:hypothetical protein